MGPRAAGVFEGLCDGEKKFFFVRAGDELDVDRQTFGRTAEGKRKAGEAGKVQPLGEAHGVSIIVRIAGTIIAGAVGKGRSGGDGQKKNRDVAELTEEIGA